MPEWIPKPLWRDVWRNQVNTTKDTIECEGCSKPFKTFKGKYQEFAYYKHIVEECMEYRRLNKLFECPNCDMHFLTGQLQKEHTRTKHNESFQAASQISSNNIN